LNNFAHFYAEYNVPLYKSHARTPGTMNHACEANEEVHRRDCYEKHVARPKLENSYGRKNESATRITSDEPKKYSPDEMNRERDECIARQCGLFALSRVTTKVTPRRTGAFLVCLKKKQSRQREI